MQKKSFLILSFFLIFSFLDAQEKKSVMLNGYVTSMQTIMFDSLKGDFLHEGLIHNRLNFKAYAGNHFSFALELRNRLFTGDMVSAGPDYADMIGEDPGLIDLSWNLVSERSFLINTTIDRYWIDFTREKFQARIGRQRINWGQSLVWNPNDIFNAYSYYDVDYIERPGCDAVRLQYFPSPSSAIELAVKGDGNGDITAAALWRFNRWGYDIQALAGYVNSNDLMAGAGWSGAIGSVSFRGEASWFQPVRNFSDTTGRGLFTIGFDKIFSDNSMLQAEVMYCNDPVKFTDFGSFYTGYMSAKDLAFSHFSAMAQGTWAATPLLSVVLSAIWMPDLKGWFLGPSIEYSLAENLGLSVIMQHFTSTMSGDKLRMNLGFLRFKYSF